MRVSKSSIVLATPNLAAALRHRGHDCASLLRAAVVSVGGTPSQAAPIRAAASRVLSNDGSARPRRQRPAAVEATLRDKVPTHLRPLADFVFRRMPGRVLVSDTLHTPTATSTMRPLAEAAQSVWVSPNTTRFVNAITVDVDHADWHDDLERLASFGCPAPTWICVDPWTMRAHLTWWLKTPVWRGRRAQAKPRAFLERVRNGLTRTLKGDPGYTGRLTKWPFAAGAARSGSGQPSACWEAHQAISPSLRWMTICPGDLAAVELRDLWEALLAVAREDGLPPPSADRDACRIGQQASQCGAGLFNAVRWRCYATGECDADVIAEWVEHAAAELGSRASSRERRAIARSIARFMQTRWRGRRAHGRGCRRMALDRRLPLPDRQRAGAAFTATTVRTRTDEKLRVALDGLLQSRAKVTQQMVASAAGVCVRTVRSRWTELTASLQRPAADPLDSPASGNPVSPSGNAACSPGLDAAGDPHPHPQAEENDITRRASRTTTTGRQPCAEQSPQSCDVLWRRQTAAAARAFDHATPGGCPGMRRKKARQLELGAATILLGDMAPEMPDSPEAPACLRWPRIQPPPPSWSRQS